MFALEDIILRLKSQHIKTLMVIKNQEVYNQLKNYNIVSQIGESRMFFDEIEAINHAKQSFKKRVKKKYFGKS